MMQTTKKIKPNKSKRGIAPVAVEISNSTRAPELVREIDQDSNYVYLFSQISFHRLRLFSLENFIKVGVSLFTGVIGGYTFYASVDQYNRDNNVTDLQALRNVISTCGSNGLIIFFFSLDFCSRTIRLCNPILNEMNKKWEGWSPIKLASVGALSIGSALPLTFLSMTNSYLVLIQFFTFLTQQAYACEDGYSRIINTFFLRENAKLSRQVITELQRIGNNIDNDLKHYESLPVDEKEKIYKFLCLHREALGSSINEKRFIQQWMYAPVLQFILTDPHFTKPRYTPNLGWFLTGLQAVVGLLSIATVFGFFDNTVTSLKEYMSDFLAWGVGSFAISIFSYLVALFSIDATTTVVNKLANAATHSLHPMRDPRLSFLEKIRDTPGFVMKEMLSHAMSKNPVKSVFLLSAACILVWDSFYTSLQLQVESENHYFKFMRYGRVVWDTDVTWDTKLFNVYVPPILISGLMSLWIKLTNNPTTNIFVGQVFLDNWQETIEELINGGPNLTLAFIREFFKVPYKHSDKIFNDFLKENGKDADFWRHWLLKSPQYKPVQHKAGYVSAPDKEELATSNDEMPTEIEDMELATAIKVMMNSLARPYSDSLYGETSCCEKISDCFGTLWNSVRGRVVNATGLYSRLVDQQDEENPNRPSIQ